MSSIEEYKKACNSVLKDFCEKHGFDYYDAKDSWVANIVGDTCFCGDYSVGLEDMIADLELNAPEDEFFEYYDYAVQCSSVGLTAMNYRSWLKGCPRYSQETIDHINKLKAKLYESEEALKKAIEEAKES